MKIKFSTLAEQDLAGIIQYITNRLHNPTAAQITVNGILHLAQHLTDFPKLGPVMPTTNSGKQAIRYVVSGNYLVLYTVAVTGIKIIRILYARSDYLRLLGK